MKVRLEFKDTKNNPRPPPISACPVCTSYTPEFETPQTPVIRFSFGFIKPSCPSDQIIVSIAHDRILIVEHVLDGHIGDETLAGQDCVVSKSIAWFAVAANVCAAEDWSFYNWSVGEGVMTRGTHSGYCVRGQPSAT